MYFFTHFKSTMEVGMLHFFIESKDCSFDMDFVPIQKWITYGFSLPIEASIYVTL